MRKINDGLTGTVRHYRRRQSQVNELKGTTCTDCRRKFPPHVLDFDHVRGKKLFNIGRYIIGRSWKKIRAEIAKCEVVCANCHRERTYRKGKR